MAFEEIAINTTAQKLETIANMPIDDVPIAESENLVKSGGVKSAIDEGGGSADIDKPIHTTLNVEIEDDGFGGYRADHNDNEINNHRNAGGIVQAKYYNQAENQTYTYYYSTMESDRKPTFIRTFINADGKTEQVLASVGNDKKVTVEKRISSGGVSQEYVDNTFAPVIKNNVSGEVIAVDDVSSVPQKIEIKASSKNLIPTTEIKRLSTGSVRAFFNKGILLKKGITYTLSVNTLVDELKIYDKTTGKALQSKFGVISNTYTPLNNVTCYFQCYKSAGLSDEEMNSLQLEKGENATAYTPYVDVNTANVLVCKNEADIPNATSYPIVDGLATVNSLAPTMYAKADKQGILLEFGYNADTKEYVGNNFAPIIKNTASGEVIAVDDVSSVPHKVEVKASSKNILPVTISGTQTISGVTFTVNDDKSITANGTASAKIVLYLFRQIKKYIKGDYFLSGTPDNAPSHSFIQLVIGLNDGTKVYPACYAGGKQIHYTGTLYDGYFNIAEGDTFNNVIFKPQLEQGTVATPYTPYISPQEIASSNVLVCKDEADLSNAKSYPIEDDLTAKVNSIAPNMYMKADKQGILLNAEYKADTKKYIDNKFKELQNAVISQGANL